MIRKFIQFCLLLAVASLSIEASSAAENDTEGLEFFENNIRPVLVDSCYACHNDSENSEAGVAVDSRDGLQNDDLVVPGKPGESRLLSILRHEIDGLEMPKDSGKLSDRVLANFEKWIAMGAPDPRDQPPSASEMSKLTSWEAVLERRKKWWSFRSIQDAKPPAVGQHPVDAFVIEKLTQAGLSLNQPASPELLVRRVYFNLIGLPPTIQQSQKWTARLAGDRTGGTAELVDHLLASPRFGERWARHWMDWIRYAESHGSEGDPRIDNAWYYRDYLIRALNQDVGYDQLLREHVAGDLLEKPRVNRKLELNESAIGPSHWRMVFHGFAPTDALDEKVRFIDDSVNAFSKAFLGMTVSCARCHDHKFDAISQADYYALFGILSSCRPGRTVVDLPERQNRNFDTLTKLKEQVRVSIANEWLANLPNENDLLERARAAKDPKHLMHHLHLAMKQIESGMSPSQAWKSQVKAIEHDQKQRQQHRTSDAVARWDLGDSGHAGNWFATGKGLENQPSKPGGFAVLPKGDTILLDIYPSGVYSHLVSSKHAGLLSSPDVVLPDDCEVWMQIIGDTGAQSRYVVQDYPRNGTVFPVTKIKPEWTWQRYDLAYWKGDSVHLELSAGKDAPLLVQNSDRSWFGIRSAEIIKKGTAGPHRRPEFHESLLSVKSGNADSATEMSRYYVQTIAEAIDQWRAGSIDDPAALLLSRCLVEGVLPNRLDALPSLSALIARYRNLEAEIAVPRRVPGLQETVGRSQPLYVRGDHRQPSDRVPHRFLEAIDAEPYRDGGSSRLRLADDLLRDDNPLTRRVIVNRIWHHLFGRGIVASPDNFGKLGFRPTHPQLLDYLANRFVKDGWSIKKMIRLIVTSEAWQQSSVSNRTALATDPQNQFLSRANVRRLDAESIRDSMLSVSGRLRNETFGAPVNGQADRRSVYVSVIRNSLDPLLRTFDFPEPFSCKGRRDDTNVPAQALTLMNGPQVTGYARSFAQRVVKSSKSDQERANVVLFSALGRQPQATEIERVVDFVRSSKLQAKSTKTQLDELHSNHNDVRQKIQALRDPIYDSLLEKAKTDLKRDAPSTNSVPVPVLSWDFEKSLNELRTGLKTNLQNGARLEHGRLIVRDGGFAVSAPVQQDIAEKTLEVWLRLDQLNQRGGGAMSIQTRSGVLFDSIVFAEQSPRQWLAGSNNFARTRPFQGSEEEQARQEFVHIAITYKRDGTITGYRNGQIYGSRYRSSGLQKFKSGDTVISFGVRHLPAGGNRLLSAQIARANLYDKALTADQVLASSGSKAVYVTQDQVDKAMTDSQRKQYAKLRIELRQIQSRIESLGPLPQVDEVSVWAELTRSVFTMKEFIYLR